MEALIPKLFILTAEASIVLFLILMVMIIFNIKAKRKDLKAVNELISNYTKSKEERISALKKQLNIIGFKGSTDEEAEKLFQTEKNVIKEFVTLYLRHDTYRLLDYSDSISENNNIFLKTSGSAKAATITQAPEALSEVEPAPIDKSEETANATILAREQAESNEAQIKELSELRLKNTELNEHLFEALETITALMTEHGKKTGQEVDCNAQTVLNAIIHLRDTRLTQDNDPSKLAPVADDHDQVDSFELDSAVQGLDSHSESTNDATLDNSTAVNLGINDELNMDLDDLDEDETSIEPPQEEAVAINLEDEDVSSTEVEDDPWADALAEQASSEEGQSNSDEAEVDPWADALAEQATAEEKTDAADEADPWAEALAEQEKSKKK